MKERVSLRSFLILAVTLGILFCFPCKAMSQATVTVGDGSGAPGSTTNKVLISLDNPDHEVMAVQLDICDEDDYIIVTDVETTSRTENFSCDFNELQSGCVRMFFFSMSLNTIEKGSGPVFVVVYEVRENAPLTECRGLNPENITVVDENNYALSVTEVPGEFCFSSCLVTISPKEDTVNSGETVQFSASNSGDCGQVPVYVFEVSSEIGSQIGGNGLYAAGANDRGLPVTDIITVTDTGNNVGDTAEITVTPVTGPACWISITPSSKNVVSGETIQFSASNSGDCGQVPIYSFEVTGEIGSDISINGLYTAGISATGDSATDTVTVYDLANSVSAAATITVRTGQSQGIINYIYPWWLLGSRWKPTYHLISITGKDTYFDHTSRVSFNPDDDIWCLYNNILSREVIVALVLLNRNPLVQYVDVTVTTGLGENTYSVTSEYGLMVSLKGFIASVR